MTISEVSAQYSTDLTWHNIEQALIAAGLNSEHLQRSDLGLLEVFHTMGPIANLCRFTSSTSDSISSGRGLSDSLTNQR